jgi:hypothetical protein
MSTDVDAGRRRFLTAGVAVVGGAAAVGTIVPFVAAWQPSERARAIGAPIEVDISKLEPGQMLTEKWRGKPVWIVSRTPEILEALPGIDDRLRDPESTQDQQPAYARNEFRSPISSRTSRRWGRGGRADSSAPATVRSSTMRAVSTRASRRPPIWWFRPTSMSAIRVF